MPSTTSGWKLSRMRRPRRMAIGTTAGRARFFQAASRSRPRMGTVSRASPAAGTAPPQPVGSSDAGSVAPPGEEAEAEQHGGGAEQSRFLAHDREDEVRVRRRQPEELLDRLPETDAVPAARAQGDDGLRGLEAGVERVLEWVGEGRE